MSRSTARSPCRPRRFVQVVILALVLQPLAACRRPPLYRLEAAERALRKAADAGGGARAPTICGPAQAALVRAQAEVRLQSRRPFFSRDDEEAERLAAQALLEAQSCLAHARAVRDQARSRAGRALDALEGAIARAGSLARHVPDGEGVKTDLLQADIILGEGRSSFAREQYERAEESASRGQTQVSRAVAHIVLFVDRFRASPRRTVWRRWIVQTLRESEHDGQPVIIVDKLRRQLLLLRGAEEIASYPVDLGLGGIESKIQAGDEATPEGRYRVIEVRELDQTRYHRALMLDYPNAEDRARFLDLKRSGRVPRHQEIGGLIEIHGRGGRGQDWTQGCVALDNDDMDDLVARVGVGIRVTIVGTIPEDAIP